MTDRKIIQITNLAPTATSEDDPFCPAVIALCDDGTLWCTRFYSGQHGQWTNWRELPEIPQDDENDGDSE